MKKIKKIKSKRAKGFSLIETLVSVFIFSLMMTLLAGSFSGFLREFMARKKEQKVLENAQYTLSLIEKTIRTSTVFAASGTGVIDFNGGDSKKIKLFDYSQSKCLAYKFDSTNKKIVLMTNSAAVTADTCGDFQFGYTESDLTSNNIKNVAVEGWVSSADNPGRVSVAITLSAPGSSSDVNISMTSSLRGFNVGVSSPSPPTFSCTGIAPTNATLCASDDTGLSANTARTLVNSCGAAKCEYTCNSGYQISGGVCVPISNSIYFTGTITRSTSYGSFDYRGDGKNSITGIRNESSGGSFQMSKMLYDPVLKKFSGGLHAYYNPFEGDCSMIPSYEVLSADTSISMIPSHSNNLTWYGDHWQCSSVQFPGGSISFDPVSKTLSGQIHFSGGSTDVWLTASGSSIVGSGGAVGSLSIEFKP